MNSKEQDTTEDIFRPVISAYTRTQAIQDSILIDVTQTAQTTGIIIPTAITNAVYADYVVMPDELKEVYE